MKQKLTPSEFIKSKNKILAKIDAFKKKTSKAEYTPLHNKYIIENAPVCINKVYEIVGRKKRGFTRFVVYRLEVKCLMDRFVLIEAIGWWLDENNDAKVFDWRTVHGTGNPTVFKLSENQKHNKKEK